MSDLIVLIQRETDTEGSRGHHTEVERQRLLGGANQPHLQAAQPQGPPISLHVAMSVLHSLLGCIYAVP